jgi:hypothetical protein
MEREMQKERGRLMWFDHEPILLFWVRKGRNALGELGIRVVHGIVR